MKYSGKLPTTNVNVTPTHPLKEFATLLLGLLAIVFTVYYLLGFAVEYAIQRISPQQEKKLAFSFIDKQFTKDRNDRQSVALQKIVDEMRSKCVNLPYEVEVFVTQKDAVNAVALPGGTILVFSGLLEKIRSENELAFILGHELGHFKHKDHLRLLGRAIVLVALTAVVLGADSGVDNFLSHFIDFSESSFSRKQESQADAFALQVVQCRYGHVSGATHFFATLMKEEEPSHFGHFLASHPESTKRIRDIDSLAKKTGFKNGNLTPLNPIFTNTDPAPFLQPHLSSHSHQPSP